MKTKKITKPTLEGDTYLIAQAVNHNAEVLEGALNRIKELEKRLMKEEPDGKLLEIEEFIKSEDMTREQAINLLDNLIGMVEDNHGSDYDIALQMAKKALEQEIFKDAYIRQVVKERDLAIGQLKELGYSLGGEKVKSCRCVGNSDNKKCSGCRYNDGEVHAECVVCNNDKSKDEKKEEHILAKIEIEKQEKWLMQAGYNALNVSIAFDSIKRALGK